MKSRALSACRAVVACHDERGTSGLRVEQRREQVGAQAGRDERPLRRAPRGVSERVHAGVLVGVFQEWSKHAQRPPGHAARLTP